MFYQLCTLILFASCINARKHENWPPAVIYNNFDIKTVVQTCLEETKLDPEIAKKFELSTDLKNLPTDRALKCYMYCQFVEFGLMTRANNNVDLSHLLDVINQMEEHEQNKYLKMSRRCTIKNKDPCEMVYLVNACLKNNDNEVRALLQSFINFIL